MSVSPDWLYFTVYRFCVEAASSVRVALNPDCGAQVDPDFVNVTENPFEPRYVAVDPETCRPESTWLSDEDHPPPKEPAAVARPL